jgi:undecaprenyl-diphosphatase
MDTFLAALMGVIEGLTEFLPVSSTGHLVLAGHFSGLEERMGLAAYQTFEIFIQLGAILAVLAAYPRRFVDLLPWKKPQGFAGIRGLWLLFITSVPAAILGVLVHKAMHEHLLKPFPVAIALAVGALWILLVERFPRKAKVGSIDEIGWREASAVGLFQCLSLWPGMSRSTSTILGGMLSGVDRRAATEYSFFAAVPIMLAATLYELYKSRSALDAASAQTLAVGFIVSFVSAYVAVKAFIRFLGRHTLVPFGWYRLLLAAAVLWLLCQ